MGKDLTKADYKIVNQAANQISKYKSRYSDEAVFEYSNAWEQAI